MTTTMQLLVFASARPATSRLRIGGLATGALVLAVSACGLTDWSDPRKLPYRMEITGVFPADAHAVDLDGDGRDEIVSIQRPTHNALRPDLESIYFINADGREFEQVNFYARVLPPHVVDLDDDGRPEVLVPFVRNDSLFVSAVDSHAQIRFTLSLTRGVPRVESTGTIPWDPHVVAFYHYDTDGDGRSELISVVSTGYARSPRGVFVHSVPDGAPRGALLVGAGVMRSYLRDFDRDGHAELVIACVTTNNGADAGGYDDQHSYLLVVSLRNVPAISYSRNMGANTFLQILEADFAGTSEVGLAALTVRRAPDRAETEIELLNPHSWQVVRRLSLPSSFTSATTGEFDPHRGEEILLASADGEILLLNGELGTVRRFRSGMVSGNFVARAPDLDGDATAELVIQPTADELYVLGASGRIKARGLRDSVVWFQDRQIRAFRPDATQPAHMLFRSSTGASTYALRLVPNRLYLAYRYGPVAAGAIGLVALPALGVGFGRLARRIRRLRSVQSLALNSAPFGLLLLRHSGQVDWMNGTLRTWLEIPPSSAAKQRSVGQLLAAAPDLLALCTELRSVDDTRRLERRAHLPVLGQHRAVNFIAERILDGKTSDWLIRVVDVTEDSDVVESRTWTLMAQRVAHDLKNPLTSILLTVQRMRREYQAYPPEVARSLDEGSRRIEDRIAHLRRMTGSFLKLVHADDPVRIHLGLSDFIESQGQLVRASLPSDIELRTQRGAESAPVLADPDQLASIVENLVANAVNALPDGGVITLVSSVVRGQRLAGQSAARDYAVLEVMDTGVGIPEDVLGRVFDPGFTTSRHGSGLGLAIVRRIVQDHGGDVVIESAADAGTVVSVYLPQAPSPLIHEKGLGGAESN